MVALIIVLASLGEADVEAPAFFAGNEELRAYLLEAAENNPGLHARHTEWLAAMERIPQVTSLDDPMFTYGQFVESETNRFKVMLSQKFPWFGTLHLRGEQAAAEAEAALARFYAARNRLFADVKQAYFDYAYLAEQIRFTRSQLEVLDYVEDLVISKLSLAMASQHEALRVSIEKTALKDRLDSLEASRPALAARLNEALGCEVCGERPWPTEAEFPPEPPPAPILLARIRVANPALAAFDHLAEGAGKAAALAKKKGYPDFTFGVEYVSVSKPRQIRPDRPYPASLNAAYRTVSTLTGATPFNLANAAMDAYALGASAEPMAYSDGGEDNLMVSLSLNVPIWRRRIRAGVAEARLKERAILHEKRSQTLGLDSATRKAAYDAEDALRRHRLHQEVLIPQAEQVYEDLQVSYSTGANADFQDVMESVQALLAFQLEVARAARDYQAACAELEMLIGGPWTENDAAQGAAQSPVEVEEAQ